MYGVHVRNIKIEEAEPGMKIAEAVYINAPGGNLLAAHAGFVLNDATIRLLKTRDVQRIPVFSDIEPTEDELFHSRENKPASESTPEAVPKYVPVNTIVDEKLKTEALSSVKQLFNCFSDGHALNKTTVYQYVAELEKSVEDLLKIVSDSSGLLHISGLKAFDDYTYHHSLSVSILAMATGRVLGMDKKMLFNLGRCAMLHDIGKQSISLDILNKKGKLTDDEFEIVKTHSVLGAENLKRNQVGDEELWNGVLHHHEKLNGTGYPHQLKGDAIPIFSKIISVADVYDAITSYRSYRNPMLPSEAYHVIYKDIGTVFDYDVVKAFFSNLEMYPVNTVVELSDGRLGIVVETDSNFRLRPAIRIWDSDEVIYLTSPTCLNIEITSVLNPADLPKGTELS